MSAAAFARGSSLNAGGNINLREHHLSAYDSGFGPNKENYCRIVAQAQVGTRVLHPAPAKLSLKAADGFYLKPAGGIRSLNTLCPLQNLNIES